MYSSTVTQSAYATRQLLANIPSLSLHLNAKLPVPRVALSIDVFPVNKHHVLDEEAQSK